MPAAEVAVADDAHESAVFGHGQVPDVGLGELGELNVKLAGSSKRSDEDIAAACLNALKAAYSVPNERIEAASATCSRR